MTDIQIAQEAKLLPIAGIAEKLELSPGEWIPYGHTKAKLLPGKRGGALGKLVLVTAINPTPAGEGKTTISVGLADGLCRIGQKAVLCLREPSLGPVFGVKGGAAGGGYAQIAPMEDLNLHFTGDLHAVTAANNVLSAAIDNHLHSDSALGLDPRRVTWRRCMDMNDRALRSLTIGLGGVANGVPREEHFNITAASEVMAILCLADGYADLKERLARIVVGYTYRGEPVTCGALRVQGAMAALLRDAMLPNLVQTLEHTPALIHGGPFANIAHGCNSLTATRAALSLGEIVVTEAGFGADLGAEKFLNIKCRLGGIWPAAAVVVATARALRAHGGHENLVRHIHNLKEGFGLPVVVAINRFSGDSDEELRAIAETCRKQGVPSAVCDAWGKGGAGCEYLSLKVADLTEGEQPAPRFTYETEAPIPDKIRLIAQKIYGAAGVEFSSAALKMIARLEKEGYGALPVCMAKTQYSLSDNPKLLGAPEGFTLHVSDVRVSAGAGFLVALTGEIMGMPGLPKAPSYEQVDIDGEGKIKGLF